MSSLVIGMDISDSHVTSALIRISQSSNQKLSIERDIYFTRSFQSNIETDPREIISIWIQSIDDLLHDFINNYQEHDDIVGISIGIPGPMDYEHGISYIQSGTFNKFFGLNIHLSLQCGLKDLISRWKCDYYGKYNPSSPSTVSTSKKLSLLEKLQQKQSKEITVTPSIIARVLARFKAVPTTAIEGILGKEFLRKEMVDYCGRPPTDENVTNEEEEMITAISKSRRETYFHDIEMSPLEKSQTTNGFSSKLWTTIEQLDHIPISFYNDTTCFALGEANNDYNQGHERILALTLGSTFGSVFLDRGEVITNREDVPSDGTLGNCAYDQTSMADDWFSTRGLINIYTKLLRQESFDDSVGTSSMISSSDERQSHDDILSITDYSLARQASNGDPNAIKAFQIYARLLGQFLIPYINSFRTNLIIISGNIAQAWTLLEDELYLTLKKSTKVPIYFSRSPGKSICLGAVQKHLLKFNKNFFRQTHQNLLPVVKNIDTSQYDIYPSHHIPVGHVGVGYKDLNEKLFNLIEENKMLLIDGFVGTYFNEYAEHLNNYYYKKQTNSSLLFYDSRTFLRTDSDSKREFYLKNGKYLFAKKASDLDFKNDFINLEKLDFLKNNLSYPCVIVGPGSSFINETSPLIYIDLAKNELYYRIASQTSFSYLKPAAKILEENNQSTSDDYELTPVMYEQKCLYFLDYPVFNKLKQELLPRMKFFIDSQRPNCPTWIDGDSLHQALAHLTNGPIRARPWFESAIWGGQWLKTVCTNISKHAQNYACSYEMNISENGLILSDANNRLIELSWEIFYGSQANKILGNDNHCRLFSGLNDFPIRFDFLDTIDGGNLSLQCNPSLQYIRTNFGEKITQDETYYIVETKQHWKEECKTDKTSASNVYLGFHDNINPEEFHQALLLSDTQKKELNVEKYIQSIPTTIHDFFLIPNETVHASGRNQVVLEISSTPYMYTFKLYDWLRLGLDNRPSLLSIELGMKNLKFDRHGEQLRCQPIRLKYEQDKYEEQHLPTHALYFYDVHRLIIEANETIEIIRSTENRFHLCMLVEGDAIEIQFNSIDDNNQQKQTRQYNYIETFLIPASINEYSLRPIIKKKTNENKSRQFILLIAFLKWDCEKLLE